MDKQLITRIERAARAVPVSSLDVDRVVRRGRRRGTWKRGASRVAVAAAMMSAAVTLWALRPPVDVLLDDTPRPATEAEPTDLRGWTMRTITTPAGGAVEIFGPSQLRVDGATIAATMVFDAAVLEFTVGGSRYAEFFRSILGSELRDGSSFQGGVLQVGPTRNPHAVESVALWQGRRHAVSTTSGSLKPSELEKLVRQVSITEARVGVVLDPGDAARYDTSETMSLHQPIEDIGALEVSSLPDVHGVQPDGEPEPVDGGDLYEEADGTLVLVAHTAIARLTPTSPARHGDAQDVMKHLTVAWRAPSVSSD